ncbi:MAG: hypothetical protein D6795_13615 [Deltaproteobacteria bacterium]|nr:MAG: hypothetical protein D6795_13615 [Deltaproteobacteria bacterium]
MKASAIRLSILLLSILISMAPACLPQPNDGSADYVFSAPVQERLVYNPDEDNPTEYLLIPGYGLCTGLVELDEWSLEMTEENTVGYSGTFLDERTGEESFIIVCLSFGNRTDRLFSIGMQIAPEDVGTAASLDVVGDPEQFVPGTTLVTANVFQLGSSTNPENISYFQGAGGTLTLSAASTQVGETNEGEASVLLQKVPTPTQ